MAHGPVVHSHVHRLNKKVRKLGLRSVLSNKFKSGKLIILEASKSDGKTSSLKKNLNKIGVNNALIISGIDVDQNLVRAAANIKNLDILPHPGLNVYDVVKKENLIIIDDALKFVEERLL
jgi:large subunit ribosomal protein L4